MEYAPIDYSDLLLANGVYFLNPQLPSKEATEHYERGGKVLLDFNYAK
jgi:hypothetical protein